MAKEYLITFTKVSGSRDNLRYTIPIEIVDALKIQDHQMATCEIDKNQPDTIVITLLPEIRQRKPRATRRH